jgi:hypothetical protein
VKTDAQETTDREHGLLTSKKGPTFSSLEILSCQAFGRCTMIPGKRLSPSGALSSSRSQQEESTHRVRKMKELKNVIAPKTCLVALLTTALLAGGCSSKREPPAVQITRVPPANPGGPQKLDLIEGSVRGAKAGYQLVLYAHSERIWFVQPFDNQPLTKILPDGTWKNSTHLGTDYAALLVDSSYRPSSRISTLPDVGNGVIAVTAVKGTGPTPVVAKTIQFSGYDWEVRAAGQDRGGEPNNFDPENAWVDENGFLHLRMTYRNSIWTCADVSLTHSLGYGTYKFVVQDSAHLNPSAVVGLYTWDDIRSVDFRNELDIELSRWGDPKSKNAQYVVQPFYVPENLFRFEAPPGVVTHSFRWEPGKVSFRSVEGGNLDSKASPISQHVFTSGVPTPANERVHIDLYEFHHLTNPSQQPSEVVIEKFEYLP